MRALASLRGVAGVPSALCGLWLGASTSATAVEALPTTAVPAAAAPQNGEAPDHYVLVEEFTAATLTAGEVKLGTDFDVGLTDHVMLGTDLVSEIVGATSIAAKWQVWNSGEHQLALGLRAAYLSKNTFLWGSVNEHFDELEAKILRPSISWTNTLSPRLKLHTFWAKGFGSVHAKLSEKGQRKLWETKHPGQDFDSRDEATNAPKPKVTADAGDTSKTSNQEKDDSSSESSLTQESIQVQSITGLAQERFQLTGEFTRANGNKVLVTSRIEQTRLEELKSSLFRLTIANQWIWSSFQMRLGIGMQYYVMSGRDLDGEKLNAAGVQPASDIGFYWRF